MTTTPEPAGETRRYDLPFTVRAPRMINTELGLPNVVARAGHNAGYAMDITLLDAPDHRLIRSGVLLGHRVLDGRGEWYLGAPDWAPLLPTEQIEPMGQAEIPESFADLVRPFRRRAALGPVAALALERAEFAFRDDQGRTLALLRDDKVTVRRGGLTTARFREVMITPVGPGLTDDQAAFLDTALNGVGATRVDGFPPLVNRLGAPATGLTDFPVPVERRPDSSFESFVSALLAGRLRELVAADLAVRQEVPAAADRLEQVTTTLADDLHGLAAVLDPLWTQDVIEELDWLVEQVRAVGSDPTGLPTASAATLLVRLRGERYLTLLERLVTGARVPPVGDTAGQSTDEIMTLLLGDAGGRLLEVADRVTVDGPLRPWEELAEAFTELDRVAAVAVRVDPGPVGRIRRRLADVAAELEDVDRRTAVLQGIRSDAESGTVIAAFEAGRAYERERARLTAARAAFCDHWPAVAARLERAAGKPERKTRKRPKKAEKKHR